MAEPRDLDQCPATPEAGSLPWSKHPDPGECDATLKAERLGLALTEVRRHGDEKLVIFTTQGSVALRCNAGEAGCFGHRGVKRKLPEINRDRAGRRSREVAGVSRETIAQVDHGMRAQLGETATGFDSRHGMSE